MPEINFLGGLSSEEVELRRKKRFLNLSAEDKIKAFFALVEISLMTGNDHSRPNAKLTLRRKSGFSK